MATKHIILTAKGEQLRKTAISSDNTNVSMKFFAVGDGGEGVGQYPILSKDDIRLKNEVWRGQIISLQSLEGQDQGKYIITAYIPKDGLGNVYLKEFGIFTPENELIYIGHLDSFYKPAIESPKAKGVVIRAIINWGYNYGINLPVNNDFTYATISQVLGNDEDTDKDGDVFSRAYIYFMSQISQ